MKNNFLIPSQVMESTILSSVNKSKMPLLKILILGFFAGMFVAFGAASSSAAMFGIHDPGLSRSLAGVIFPVGLMMILFVVVVVFKCGAIYTEKEVNNNLT